MAPTYMRDVTRQTFREKTLCCHVLNMVAQASDEGGPFAAPESLEYFSVAAVRAALVVMYPDLTEEGQRLAVVVLDDLSEADGEPVPAVEAK